MISGQEIDDLKSEMEDRFGKAPLPVLWLISLAKLKCFGSANQFSLFQFRQALFTVEKTVPAQPPTRKTFQIPQKIQHPVDLELHILTLLKTEFTCENDPVSA